MRKSLVILLSIVAFIAVPVIAAATPITFTDTTKFTADGTIASEDLISYGGSSVYKLESFGDWVTWEHQFTLAPPAAQILSGTLTLYLTDDDIDSDVIGEPWTFELGIGFTEDGSWYSGEVDTNQYTYGTDVAYLVDGLFEVTLASKWGDFYICKSELEITYEPIPEPGTMLLLGLGLTGLFGVRKKFKI